MIPRRDHSSYQYDAADYDVVGNLKSACVALTGSLLAIRNVRFAIGDIRHSSDM